MSEQHPKTRTKVVNLIGAPGVGKSTFAALIYANLKLKHKSVEYVQEYVKHLIWQGRTDELNNQYYVSQQQYKMLKAIDGKLEYIITDGALLHGLYYNKVFPWNVSNIEKTNEMILEKIDEFNNIYIFLERGDFPYEREGRIHSYEESVKIEEDLESLLKIYDLNYFKVKSDISNLEEMMRIIEQINN